MRHLVIVSGNDSSLPTVPPPDTIITLVQTADRATDTQRSRADNFIEVPVLNADRLTTILCQLNDEMPISALVCFLEPVLLVAATAAQRLGIRTNSPEAVATARHKVRTRQALDRAGIPQLPWKVCDDAEQAICFRHEAGLTEVIVKPVTGAGSAGVWLARTDEEVRRAFDHVQHLRGWALLDNPTRTMLVEAVLPGKEVSVEAFSYDGHHEVLAITGKVTTGRPNFVELAHWQPAELDPRQGDIIARRVCEVLSAIGHEIGPSHTEVMVDGEDVWVVETHTRFGGGQIWELTELTTGRHLATETIFAILGLEAPAPGPSRPAAAISFMEWCAKTDAGDVEDLVRVVLPTARTLDERPQVWDSSDLNGYAVATGPTADAALSTTRSVIERLQGDLA